MYYSGLPLWQTQFNISHMKKNKQSFCGSDVGTKLLFVGLLTSSAPAQASYIILENYGALRPVLANMLPAPPGPDTQQQTRQRFSIPFHKDRATFGPHGYRTMRTVCASNAQHITIIGRPDNTSSSQIALKRANAIKAWLEKNGIPNNKLSVQIESSPIPNGWAQFFDSEIFIEKDNRPATMPPPEKKRTILAPSYLNQRTTTLNTSVLYPPDERTLRASSPIMTTPAAMPIADASHIWQIFAGQTLHAAITSWSTEAGWHEPVWIPSDPYYIETNFNFNGTLIDALTKLNSYVPSLDFNISVQQHQIIITDHQ